MDSAQDLLARAYADQDQWVVAEYEFKEGKRAMYSLRRLKAKHPIEFWSHTTFDGIVVVAKYHSD